MVPPAIDWSLKTRALLLPTPFYGLDRDGEPARAAEVEAWLESRVAPLANRDLLERCRDEAYDAMATVGSPGSDPPRVPRIQARHPLSAEALGEPWLQTSAERLWKAFWGKVTGDPVAPSHIASPSDYLGLFACWSRAVANRMGGDLSLLPTDAARPDCPVWAHRRLASALAGGRCSGDEPALLYVHIGPVQSFIEAARRTHDLWVGSFTLSYLVLQGAKAVAERLGPDVLVYPDIAELPLARKVVFGDTLDGRDPMELLRASLANRFLAIVPTLDARAAGQAAMEAVNRAWKEMAERVKEVFSSVAPAESWQGFLAQRDAHLEMEAIVQRWPSDRAEAAALLRRLPVPGDPSRPEDLLPRWPAAHENRVGFAYGTLFDLTHRVLGAHRATFTESPATTAVTGGSARTPEDYRPKCTQCGLREQMGPQTSNPRAQHRLSREFWQRVAKDTTDATLQLNEGEGLCAICLTKRFAPQAYFGAGGEGARLGLSWDRPADRARLRFPSTASIAAAPFRRLLTSLALEEGADWGRRVGGLCDAFLHFTSPGNLLPGLGPIGRGSELLSPDGSWLFEASYEPRTAWTDHGRSRQTDGDPQYPPFRNALAKVLDSYRAMRSAADDRSARLGMSAIRPSAYYAVVKLDGDAMGKWLTGRHPDTPTLGQVLAASGIALDDVSAGERRPLFPALHGELSRRLASLARAMHGVVDGHLGRVVYSGGDDLLAFVPLSELMPCLRAIRRTFQDDAHLGNRARLSAGVAIAHWRDPLELALVQARDAEKDAKKDDGTEGKAREENDPSRRHGDRFSVRVLKRAGADLRVTLPWETKGGSAIQAIEDLVSYRTGTPENDREVRPLGSPKVAYKLREELAVLGDDLSQIPREAFVHRLEVLLGYKRKRDGARTGELPSLLRELHPRRTRDVLLLARFLLREQEQDVLGNPPDADETSDHGGVV